MKAFRFIIALSVILALFSLAVKPVAAAGVFPTYVTGTQVMNVGSGLATIGITYYDGTGGVVGTTSDTIASFASKTYFPPGSGSAVISSDQPLAAVTNIINASSAPTASAAYIGASAGSTSVGLPLLFKNTGGFYTWYTVQNAGSADATVNVVYSDCTTQPAAVVIKPGAGFTYFQNEETCHSLTSFSAKLTSTQPVVVVTVEEHASPTPYLFAFNGFPKGSTNPVLPLINSNNNGVITGVQMQNLGASDSAVTVSYTPSSAGTACTETQTVPAGKSKTFALFAFNSGPYNDPSNKGVTNCAGLVSFVGSARVTANAASMPLVAVVNQLGAKFGEAYDGFDPADSTGTVVLPLIMDRNFGFYTGISVMNAGAAATNIKCTFAGNIATSYTASKTNVAANASLINLQGNAIANGWVGSATCKAYSDAGFTTPDPAGKLVAIVNELGTLTLDNLLVYEGINIP